VLDCAARLEALVICLGAKLIIYDPPLVFSEVAFLAISMLLCCVVLHRVLSKTQECKRAKGKMKGSRVIVLDYAKSLSLF
jgi:hypothetical protein